jgi:hypothetical protein
MEDFWFGHRQSPFLGEKMPPVHGSLSFPVDFPSVQVLAARTLIWVMDCKSPELARVKTECQVSRQDQELLSVSSLWELKLNVQSP